MKKTQRKYLFRTIKKNFISFLSVVTIATTGVSIYLGDQSTAVAILDHANNYFIENNLQSLEATSANGITEEDIEAISGWEGVDDVEGGYSSMVMLETGTEQGKILIQAHAMLDRMNQPVILEGTLPKAENEAAIEQKMAETEGIKVGDTLLVDHKGELNAESFKVTAIINEPAYSCVQALDSRGSSEIGIGSAYYYISLPKEAFDKSHFDDCYTTAYIKNNTLDQYYYFSDEYKEHEAAFQEQIETLGKERAQIRYDSIKERVHNELADAREELADAEQEIEDGKVKLADAEQELADGESELVKAKQELADGESELASARRTFNNKKSELANARNDLTAALQNAGLPTDLNQAKAQLQMIGEAGAPLLAAINEYNSGESQLANAEREIASAEREIADAEAEIADAETEIANAKAEIEDARTELADAETKLAEAQDEYDDAEKEAQDIEAKDWIVSVRNEIGDVRSIDTIVSGLYGLSYSMAIIFLIVSITVCHTAITRMISEQRTLIGVQKSLGFTDKEIFRHYMSYSLICGIWGIVEGWFLAFYLTQGLNLGIYEGVFALGKITPAFSWPHAIIVSVICIIIFAGSAYAACAKEITLPATELLRGEMPQRDKPFFFENWKIYQKRKLYTRTMLKNALEDKARVITTIMGVVGCMSLLVMCFTLQSAMDSSSVIQFDKYFLYDNRLVVDSEECDPEEFEKVLDAEGISYARIQDKMSNIRSAGRNWSTGHVVAISDAEKLKDYMLLEDPDTDKVLEVPDDGVLVSVRYAQLADLSEGSVIEIMDKEGKPREAVVAGVIDNYMRYHMFVTSDSYYEEVTGQEVDECVFLIKGSVDGLYEKVGNMEGFISLRDNSEYGGLGDMMDMVVLICFIFAIIMAILVLFNQNVMYINRKAKELSVMRINGFKLRETKAFVSKDITILTVMGLLIGCGVGMVLGYIVIRVQEMGAIRYIHAPSSDACISALVLGGVLAFIMNKLALRRIRRLNLTDINAN